jgi:Phage capsid family
MANHDWVATRRARSPTFGLERVGYRLPEPADYFGWKHPGPASQLDQQCLYGSGTNGQVLGVNNTPNIGTIAVSTLDISGVYSAIANAIQTVHTTRFQPPEVVVMHPRRWGWFLALLDNQQRPLFLPDANRPYNAAGILEEVASQQVVGSIQGLPVVTDPNIATTSGCRHRGHRLRAARVRRRAVGIGDPGKGITRDQGAEPHGPVAALWIPGVLGGALPGQHR